MLISTVVAAGLAVAIERQQQGAAARWFAMALFGTAIAALGSAVEAAVVPTWAKLLASKFAYIGNVIIAPCFLMFSLEHTQPRVVLSRARRGVLLGLPLLCLLGVWTNEWHLLCWPKVTETIGPQGHALYYDHGPVVWCVAGYSYLLLAICAIVLLRTVHHGPALYRRQARPVTVAIVTGVVANAAYLAGLSPWPGVDLMPVVMSLCGALLGWSVFGLRLLDLAPVARGFAVEHLADAVLTFDNRRRLVDANPAARTLLASLLVPGRPAAEVLANLPVVLAALEQAVDGRVDQALEAGDGELRWLDASLTTLRWLERPVGMVVVVRDVSEARRAEANRRDLQRRLSDVHHEEALGRLAGGVAHHFNNQLGVVLGHLELAQHHLAALVGGDVVSSHLDQVRAAGERMATISREMLAYCGGLTMQRQQVDLGALLTATADLLRTGLPKHVCLTVRVAPDLPTLRVDANELRKVVGQLISNAAEACPDGGEVVLAARGIQHDGQPLDDGWENAEAVVAGAYVELAVRDNGQGMEADTMEHAFEPFYSTKFTGRGLGLAQVVGLVRGHGGAVRLDSTLGHGTTVTLWLPTQSVASAD